MAWYGAPRTPQRALAASMFLVGSMMSVAAAVMAHVLYGSLRVSVLVVVLLVAAAGAVQFGFRKVRALDEFHVWRVAYFLEARSILTIILGASAAGIVADVLAIPERVAGLPLWPLSFVAVLFVATLVTGQRIAEPSVLGWLLIPVGKHGFVGSLAGATGAVALLAWVPVSEARQIDSVAIAYIVAFVLSVSLLHMMEGVRVARRIRRRAVSPSDRRRAERLIEERARGVLSWDEVAARWDAGHDRLED